MGLACKISGHQWNGCTCARCGERRGEGHKWVKAGDCCTEKCAVCGADGEARHTFKKSRQQTTRRSVTAISARSAAFANRAGTFTAEGWDANIIMYAHIAAAK